MHAETTLASPTEPQPRVPPARTKPPRLWPALALVALFWIVSFVVAGLNKSYFVGFLSGMATSFLLTLSYLVWWWTSSRIRLLDRLYGFAVIAAGGVAVAPFCHPSIGWFGLLVTGLPVVLTDWTLWMLLTRMPAKVWYRVGSVVVVLLSWGFFTLIRIDGVNGELKPDFHWRWNPTAEDRFLAGLPKRAGEEA